MKFRFESSSKEMELSTSSPTVTIQEFVMLVQNFFFKDKEATCSFEVINYEPQYVLKCDSDIPIIRKSYNSLFVQPKQMEMVGSKKKQIPRRWRSRSPIKRKRWVSRSPDRYRNYRYQ